MKSKSANSGTGASLSWKSNDLPGFAPCFSCFSLDPDSDPDSTSTRGFWMGAVCLKTEKRTEEMVATLDEKADGGDGGGGDDDDHGCDVC